MANKKKRIRCIEVVSNLNTALDEQSAFETRKFYKTEVLIETINGNPIKVMVWKSDAEPNQEVCREAEEELEFKCEVCGKVFSLKAKLKSHVRCHNRKVKKGVNMKKESSDNKEKINNNTERVVKDDIKIIEINNIEEKEIKNKEE